MNRKLISSDSVAYKRGVVLGLTMAEILLILLFCLAFLGVIALKNFQEAKSISEKNSEKVSAEVKYLTNRNTFLNESNTRLKQVISNLRQEIFDDRELKNSKIENLQSELKSKSIQLEERVIEIATHEKKDEQNQHTISVLRTEILSQNKIIDNQEELVLLFDELIEKLGITPIDDDWETLVDKLEIIETLEQDHNLSHEEVMTVLKELDSYLLLKMDQNLDETSLTELIELAKMGQINQTSADEHDWPPFINLSEAEGFSFEIGKATLSDSFEQNLRGPIAIRIALIAENYNASIVEVVGHTDEQPIRRKETNLDNKIISALNGEINVDALSPGDNAGLGFARAVSVAKVLNELENLKHLTVLPLSGGQLIIPVDKISNGTQPGDLKERRRIEIRVRRAQTIQNPIN